MAVTPPRFAHNLVELHALDFILQFATLVWLGGADTPHRISSRASFTSFPLLSTLEPTMLG